MRKGITLITMGAGNVLVLKDTLDSFKHVCNEVIYGDLLLFPEDRKIVESYCEKYNLKIIPFKFDFLFRHGFSKLLNILSGYSSNDFVIYMNTSEIIEKDNGISDLINDEYNCYYFDHATDGHRWYRMYNRLELKWSGRIHESLVGEHRPYHKPIFRMADLEKDMGNEFKAKVLNSLKEMVYFNNYMAIIDDPKQLGGTDPGWIQFASENYNSMKERLLKKGAMYDAMVDGDYKRFMLEAYSDKEFKNEQFVSSNLIEYQGDPKYLGK